MTDDIKPMSDVQRQRWEMLAILSASQVWWAHVFCDGGFVAGGAAVFVGDTRQCVRNVGDIDLWAPVPDSVMWTWLAELRDLHELHCEPYYVLHTPGSATFTVGTAHMKIQFIKLPHSRNRNTDVLDRLSKFDFTYTQAALLGAAFSFSGVLTPPLLCVTADARAAWLWQQLKISANGFKIWSRHLPLDMTRLMERIEKSVRKGFTVAGSAPSMARGTAAGSAPQPHVCNMAHHEPVELDLLRGVYDDPFNELPVFDETNYTAVSNR